MEIEPSNPNAMKYRQQGVARDVLRASGIDFTGDRLVGDSEIVRESPMEAAVRMAEIIRSANPGGIDLLREAGIEV